MQRERRAQDGREVSRSDVLVRLQKAHDQDATAKKIESLEAQLKATTEDITHLNNIVRDQTTRLTLSRKRSG